MMRADRGFSLVEVLVAVAILSFGMLGIAAMQVTGMRANQGSYFRSQATYIASDMAERIYANRAAARLLRYDGLNSDNVNCGSAVPTRCSVDKDNVAIPAACTEQQMFEYDRFHASCGYPDGTARIGGVRDMLPNGRLQVVCVTTTAMGCTADSLRRIVIQWDERTDYATAATATATSQSAGAVTVATPRNQTVSMTVQP